MLPVLLLSVCAAAAAACPAAAACAAAFAAACVLLRSAAPCAVVGELLFLLPPLLLLVAASGAFCLVAASMKGVRGKQHQMKSKYQLTRKFKMTDLWFIEIAPVIGGSWGGAPRHPEHKSPPQAPPSTPCWHMQAILCIETSPELATN